jgi:hypothetical protein
MRRFIAVVLASLLVFAGTPPTFAAARSTGTITGVARSTAGQPLGGHFVRVRSVRTGDVVATATTSVNGSFVVPNLDPGSYVVEIVDTAGRIVGTSAIATVVEGSIVSSVVTGASRELVGGINTALLVTLIAAAGGAVAAIVVATTGDEASPSR